jgi:predicted nucleotidyltransferase
VACRIIFDPAFHLEDLFSRKGDLLTVKGIDRYIRSRVESEVIWIEG